MKVDHELYVVGRIKDMIIQRGVNHTPQDVEFTAEQAHPRVRVGGAAVFTVAGSDEEDQRAILLSELDRYSPDLDLSAILTAIRETVTEVHGLELGAVALVRKGQIPKTTSGKVRRRETATRWQTGRFDVIAAWPDSQLRGGA